MKTYNIGIIGYGGFGKFLHHWWNQMEKVNVVAYSGGSAKDIETQTITHYDSWKELLKDDTIDIVSIATPPSLHVEMACEAMRNNKHVLLEKPVAINLDGAEEILRTQQETGKVITVNHMLRYDPIVDSLIQLSKDETFGKLRHAVVSNYAQDESLSAEHWFWDKAVSGGILIEHAVHFFDIINGLTNQKIVKVTGATHNRNEQQEDQVSATVSYSDGLIASHYHMFSGPGFFEQTTIRLTYDLARIEVEGWVPMTGRFQALLDKPRLDQLSVLSGLKIEKSTPITELNDFSRPEGWGDLSENPEKILRCGGLEYKVDKMVSGTFGISKSKSDVYGACVQNILADVIEKIENPDHKLKITVEDAYESLKIAVAAYQSAQDSNNLNY
jgi:predicted dehydrogenase